MLKIKWERERERDDISIEKFRKRESCKEKSSDVKAHVEILEIAEEYFGRMRGRKKSERV